MEVCTVIYSSTACLDVRKMYSIQCPGKCEMAALLQSICLSNFKLFRRWLYSALCRTFYLLSNGNIIFYSSRVRSNVLLDRVNGRAQFTRIIFTMKASCVTRTITLR